MSAAVAIQVNITCLAASMKLMVDGLKELHEAMQVEDVTDKSGPEACVQSCTGEAVKVDYVIRNKQGDRIGVRANPKTQAVEFVHKEPEKPSVKASVEAAKQAYARLKILNEVKGRGYAKVKEQKLPNGSIRLVVERWR